jgi:hypothetical protein
MAWEQPGRTDGTRRAAIDMSVKANYQYRCVVVDATGRVTRNTASGGQVYGILQNDPGLNQASTVMLDGATKVRAGAAVAAGAKVMSDAAGRIITATTGGNIIGTCLLAAAAEGEIITIQMERLGLMP